MNDVVLFFFFVGWNDGKIRVFAPESGRLLLIIHNTHRTGVTAIAGTRDCKRIVSGGEEGQVSSGFTSHPLNTSLMVTGGSLPRCAVETG